MGVTRRRLGSVACAAAGAMLAVSGCGSGEPHAPDRGDLRELDAYAAELGTVMARSSGPDAASFARRVDNPADDEVQILQLSGSSREDGALVVLRITREHVETDWFGSVRDRWPVSVCYRWMFKNSVDDGEPERLGECPDTPVITLLPLPPDPELPDGLTKHVERALTDLVADGGQPVVSQVRAAVREAYTKAAKDDVAADQPIPSASAVLHEGAGPVERDGAIGIGLSAGDDCLMVRVIGGSVEVWSPSRIQLMPGELTCDAATAASGAGQRPPL